MSYPKLSNAQIADVVAYHVALTEAAFPAPKTDLSEKAKAAQAVIATGAFGCNSKAVAELVSAILGETIFAPLQPGTILPGAVVCMLNTLEQEVFIIGVQHKDGGIRGIYPDGTATRNNIPLNSIGPANKEDIERFFEIRHGEDSVFVRDDGDIF